MGLFAKRAEQRRFRQTWGAKEYGSERPVVPGGNNPGRGKTIGVGGDQNKKKKQNKKHKKKTEHTPKKHQKNPQKEQEKKKKK